MRCLNCGKEIIEKPCRYCGSEKANITLEVQDVVSVTEVTNVELTIEVLATPIGKKPIKSEYPFSTEAEIISRSTVTPVTDHPDEMVPMVTKFIDVIKKHYKPDEDDIVIKVTEIEEEDKGWFSHFNSEGGLSLSKGSMKFKIKGDPKKTKRFKEKTISIGIEKKNK